MKALPAALSLCLLLLSCAQPCEQISTCEVCAGASDSQGCGWCPSSSRCTADAELCAAPRVFLSERCVPATGAGGGSASTSSNCSATYKGPTGDPQVSTHCMSIWNNRCTNKNDAAANQGCLVYASLNATVSCPYCSGANGTGGGSGSGGGGGSTSSGACYSFGPNGKSVCNEGSKGICPSATNPVNQQWFAGKKCSEVYCNTSTSPAVCTVK